MFLLILGLLLWVFAHFFKRIAPAQRQALTDRFGDASKGFVAGGIGLGLILMIIGYRSAGFVEVYATPGWTIHLNNMLMLIAIALFGAGQSKGRVRALMRHPMLTGMIVWAVAHLIVNGDLASLILFGGLGVWAIAEMRMINAAEPAWDRPEPGPVSGDVRLGIITFVLYIVIVAIHSWVLGYPTYPV